MKHITTEDALRALEEAVAEKGEDYVYERVGPAQYCYYVLDGQPSCIVGNAMHRLGLPLSTLSEWDTKKFFLLPEYLVPAMDPEAHQLFDEVQGAHDDGLSWGDALAAGRELVTPDA